jgi:hypothetical protein
MSGIVGSKFNHRGSGLIGSLGTDGQHLLSSGAGKTNVFETVSAATDLTPVRQDILTLALKQAVQENSTKFNLPNSAICKFEADADFDLAGSTTTVRNASEYITTAYAAATQFTDDANTELLLHFDGDNDSTTFTDSSSNTRSVSAGGNAHLDTAIKKLGTASLQLDGSGDYIDVPASADFAHDGDFTIETWVYYTSGSIDKRAVFVFNGTHDQAYEIWLHKNASNYLGYEMRNSNNTVINTDATTPVFVADTWYHVAFARDGSTFRHYVDGVQYDANTEGGAVTGTLGHGSSVFRIGKRNDDESIEGYLDEFRVSDTCRYPDGTTFVPNADKEATGTALGTTNVPTSAVTDVSGVMLLKDAEGTTTLGTDVKAYFTADNSAWTEATSYADAGTFSTGIKMIKLGKTTCTSGSDVRWKIVWANQVHASKEGHIYGIGLNY